MTSPTVHPRPAPARRTPGRLNFLSCCAGIEAASVAWNGLGWHAAAFSEISRFPSAVLAHHYPDVPNLGDMTRFQEWPNLGSVDLVVGGTPCQSYSVAGLRAGLDDPRGDLMLTFGAIARAVGARWLVWENVPGVLSSNGGRDFGTFLGLLAELGYGFAYRILDAQFCGVPQQRRRVFVVGHLGDWRRAAAVLFERSSLSGNPAPSREAGEEVAAVAAIGSYRGGFGLERDVSPCLQASGGEDSRGVRNPLVALSLNAHGNRMDGESETFVTHFLRADGFDASEDGTGRGTPLVATAFDARQSDVIQYGDKTGPLDTCGFTMGVQAGSLVRRLTPRECERLQGFPDDYTLVPYRKGMAKDGPRYSALGNSMAVPVMRWIGERIMAVEAIQERKSDAQGIAA